MNYNFDGVDQDFLGGWGGGVHQIYKKLNLKIQESGVTVHFRVLVLAFHISNLDFVGVSCFKSESLSLINLDGTHVKPRIVEILHNQCPNLQKVTTANIVLSTSDEED